MSLQTNSVNNQLADQLRLAGYKATPARIEVLKVLEQASLPLSVEKIKDTLKGRSIDQATLYRTLNALRKAGIVKHIDFQHGHAHYELASKGDHHHIVCVRCHRVEDVEECQLEKMMQQALKSTNFQQIVEHSLEFFGICDTCAAK